MASKAIRITYVNDAVISRRLWGIYSKILRRDIANAKILLNDTIRTLSYAETENPEISSACIDALYRVLVDLAFKRVDEAHSKLRDLYYNIEEPYMQQPANLIDDIIEA